VKEINVRLVAERTIEGTVVQEDGSPVPGAHVRVQRAGAIGRRPVRVGSTRADKQGRFRLGQLGQGSHELTVDAGGDFVAPETLEVRAGTKDVVIRVHRGITARLLILDAAGKATAAARVRVYPNLPAGRERASIAHLAQGARGQSAADGSVILRGLAPGFTYRLEVVPSDARLDLRLLRVRAWTPADGELRLERGMSIGGEVRDQHGKLVKGAHVRLESEHLSTALHAPEGRFLRTRLVPGTYTLTAGGPDATKDWDAWAKAGHPSVTVKGDTLEVVLILPKR